MSAVSEVMAVLMDALEEAGDTEAVEALRNLERLKKVQKHWDRLRQWVTSGTHYADEGDCQDCGAYDGTHYLNCEIAPVLCDLFGQEEIDRQYAAAWDAALREEARRARPRPPPVELRLLGSLNEMFKQAYPAQRITGLAGWLPEVPPRPENFFQFARRAGKTEAVADAIDRVSVIADKNVPEGTAYLIPPYSSVFHTPPCTGVPTCTCGYHRP